jgi:hypothetical protein
MYRNFVAIYGVIKNQLEKYATGCNTQRLFHKLDSWFIWTMHYQLQQLQNSESRHFKVQMNGFLENALSATEHPSKPTFADSSTLAAETRTVPADVWLLLLEWFAGGHPLLVGMRTTVWVGLSVLQFRYGSLFFASRSVMESRCGVALYTRIHVIVEINQTSASVIIYCIYATPQEQR